MSNAVFKEPTRVASSTSVVPRSVNTPVSELYAMIQALKAENQTQQTSINTINANGGGALQ